MRTFFVIGLAVLLGAGLGFGVGTLRVKVLTPTANLPGTKQAGTITAPIAVVVGTSMHLMGNVDYSSAGQHVFQVSNTGRSPLTLRLGPKSCSCVVPWLATTTPKGGDKPQESAEVPPGSTLPVLVQWNTKGFKGKFSQNVTLLTNDPELPQIVLAVSGQVLEAYKVLPPEIDIGNIPIGESAHAETRVFGMRKTPFEIQKMELSEPKTAKYFEVTHTPLSAEELKKIPTASSGYKIRVLVKPGLPSGAFKQRILLSTGTNEQSPDVEIPVQGVVNSELSVLGLGWNPEEQTLILGGVSRETGTERKLSIVARGPRRKELKFKVVKVVPDLLQVSIGETEAQGSQITQTPLTVRIPKGSRVCQYLGPEVSNCGRITIETNHPKVPRFDIIVSFAVTE